VYAGTAGELMAVREIGDGKYVVAVYKETSHDDGFVITAFLTRRVLAIQRRRRVWPR